MLKVFGAAVKEDVIVMLGTLDQTVASVTASTIETQMTTDVNVRNYNKKEEVIYVYVVVLYSSSLQCVTVLVHIKFIYTEIMFGLKLGDLDVIVAVTCVLNVQTCANGVCTCNEPYTGPGCCDCEAGYYNDGGTCKGKTYITIGMFWLKDYG